MNIESGAYLNPSSNPYLSGTLTTAEQGVQNPITSEFGSAGRNVLSSAPVQSSAMNQLANQIYGGAYQSGMQNMVREPALCGSLDQATYLPFAGAPQDGRRSAAAEPEPHQRRDAEVQLSAAVTGEHVVLVLGNRGTERLAFQFRKLTEFGFDQSVAHGSGSGQRTLRVWSGERNG